MSEKVINNVPKALKDKNHLCYICPLYDLIYQGPEIILSKALSIIQVDDETKLYLAKSLPFVPRSFQEVTSAIKRKYRMRPDGGLRWVTLVGANTELLLRELLIALRVYTAGSVQLGPIIESSWLKQWFGIHTFHPPGYHLEPITLYDMNKTMLSNTDATEFAKFWRKLRRGQPSRALVIAANRFDSAYYHRQPTDRLIDYIIALESLFTGDIQELSYKLALRAATFLGGTDAERRRIFSILGQAYIARSQTIHGQEPRRKYTLESGGTVDIYSLVNETENILRKALYKLIMTQPSRAGKPLHKFLDQKLLESS